MFLFVHYFVHVHLLYVPNKDHTCYLHMYSELFEMNNKCTNTAYNVLAVSGVFCVCCLCFGALTLDWV